jgi:hypothetical protein
VYSHYNVTLRRLLRNKKMYFIFTCKHGNRQHEPLEWARSKTSDGTTNLSNSSKKCDCKRGVPAGTSTSTGPIAAGVLLYSVAAHRTILTLWCATSHRPLNITNNKYLKILTEFLRPGTKVPLPRTVSLDIKNIYLEFSKYVRTYFKVSSTSSMITQGTDVAIDTKPCCPSCNRRVDCSADILISWGCCNMV